MEIMTALETATHFDREAPSHSLMSWLTLARFLGGVFDHHLAQDAAKRALFEPRHAMTPDGYHPPDASLPGCMRWN